MNKFEIEIKLKKYKLPERWAKVKLGSLLIEPKERNITNKKLLVFSITNVKGFVLQDEYFSHNIHSKKTTNYKIFRENYFGYNPARVNVGSIALSEKQREGLLSPMYVIFKTKSTLNPKYLKYFIQTSHFKNNVINNVVGSVRESLNYSSLEMFDFIYPISISEQNRIVEILETVDEIIGKTGAIIEKYKRIKQGLMQNLLIKGIDGNGQIRSEETHKFKDSPLGRIPEEWEVVELGKSEIDIIDGDRGVNYPKLGELSKEGYCLFLNNKNIENGKIIFIECQYITKEKNLKLGSGKVRQNDIILTTRGTLGNIAFISNKNLVARINSGMVILRNCKKLLSPIFFVYLWSFIFKKSSISLSSGSAQPQLPIKDLIAFKFIVPSFPEQQRIASILSQIDETIEKEQNYKEKLERIKQGLMEDLLTGKVRVLNIN